MIKLLAILLWVASMADISDIKKINGIKRDAEKAFKSGNWEEAVAKYSYLLDTLHIEDEQATMNLAHVYYQNGQKDFAQSLYSKLVLSKNRQLKSTAFQQLGALSNDPKTLEKALAYFKESIKSDPTNEDSRYNYELVKKKLKQQQDQQRNQDQQDQNKENEEQNKEDRQDQDQQKQDQKDQENQEQQEQENQDQQDQQDQEKQDQQDREQQEQDNKEQEEQQEKDGDEKEEKTPQQQTLDKLKEMNISEEKARMILEALKNNEIQYIQQNRRKATKRKDSDKPDW